MHFFFEEYGSDKELIKYYGVLRNRKVIQGYKWYKTIRYKMLPVLIHKRNAVRFLKDVDYKSDKDNWQPLREEQLIQMTKKRFEDWKVLTGVDVEHDRIEERAQLVKQKNFRLLLDITRKIRTQGIRVYFVIPPFTDIFNSRISSDFLYREYEALLGELADITGSRLLNYREDAGFVSHYEYFRNADCLNPLGAEKFTHMVMQEVMSATLSEDRAAYGKSELCERE